jgi:hypothetical protein
VAKTSGLGDNFFIGGYDLSGDTNSLGNIGGGNKPIVVTAINKLAFERLGGVRDGAMAFTSYFNTAAGHAHPVLSALPTADTIGMYCQGTLLGNPCASVNAKQVGYDGNRTQAGDFTFASTLQSNGYGLEWGRQLTAGLRTDTAATNGTAIDTVASAAFGAQAYLQVNAFAGTDVTVKIQDSADNSSFADVTGLTFTQITAAPGVQRLATASGATIRQYVRAVTVTTGGFVSCTFAVQLTKNEVTVAF